MRITSMDAKTTSYLNGDQPIAQNKELKTDTKENTTNVPDGSNTSVENKNISQITSLDKMEMPISDRIVIEAIERANKAISGANTKFEFSIHDKTKQIMVKVIDSDTNKVIRELPPEKVLDMVARMWEMAGIMVDERR